MSGVQPVRPAPPVSTVAPAPAVMLSQFEAGMLEAAQRQAAALEAQVVALARIEHMLAAASLASDYSAPCRGYSCVDSDQVSEYVGWVRATAARPDRSASQAQRQQAVYVPGPNAPQPNGAGR